jgi:type IV pilus assembly protein PilC
MGGLITLITMIALVLFHKYLLKNNKGYKGFMDAAVLKLPLFGNIILQATIARIALIKANLFAAGVDVLEILDIAMSSTTNTLYIEALGRIKRGVFSGEDMSKLVEKEAVFPATYYQLIAVGERTGNLEEMFSSISSYYEEEFDSVVKNLSTMIEPLSMVLIGGIVATLLIAMYLPIFSAGSVVG